MLKEVTKFVWNEVVEDQAGSIFNDSEYLELISDIYKTKLKFWLIYSQKNKPVIGFATHIKYNSITVPDHYGYSSFWKHSELGAFSFFDYLDKALSDLKKAYKSIKFRLPPDIFDIRAFNNNGFNSRTSFTYLKDTKAVNDYRKNIFEKIKIANKESFIFSYAEKYEKILLQQINDFECFGYSKSKINFYKAYFQKLIDCEVMKSFAVFKDDELIASALLILDFDKRTAYNILLSSSKTNYGAGVNAFLYDNIIKKLHALGIEKFDLYGADMKGIANFKSGFNGELVPHYTVNYSLINNTLKNILFQAKKIIKKFM